MESSLTISIVIPSYNRVNELSELMESILKQEIAPDEVIICEDNSPQKNEIRKLASHYKPLFLNKKIKLVYEENESNLGYDKNLRKGIELSSSEWSFVIGNDDLFLPNAIHDVKCFLNKNNGVNFISRTFLRFNTDISKPIGISRISFKDEVFDKNNSEPNIIFRTAGFVGGLVINTSFARKNTTTMFDGSLYYQIYLAAVAYCNGGIGYISTPIVGGRADNPPMFGNAADDNQLHIPGGYTAKGRASMWRGVLTISEYVGEKYKIDLYTSLHRELMIRQAFHVFEMNAGQSMKTNYDLINELGKLGLMKHYVPWGFFLLNSILGKYARIFYKIVRKKIQAN